MAIHQPMSDVNRTYNLHDETATHITSALTELAQIKRAVGQHEEANMLEVRRNTLYAQHAEAL